MDSTQESREEREARLANSTTLYVGNLSFYTTEAQIYERKIRAGTVPWRMLTRSYLQCSLNAQTRLRVGVSSGKSPLAIYNVCHADPYICVQYHYGSGPEHQVSRAPLPCSHD